MLRQTTGLLYFERRPSFHRRRVNWTISQLVSIGVISLLKLLKALNN